MGTALTACYTAGNVAHLQPASGKLQLLRALYGNGMFFLLALPNATHLSSTPVTGNGTIAEQNSAFMGKISDELKDASPAGRRLTADGSHNNGYPYLSGVKAPGSGGSGALRPGPAGNPSRPFLEWG